MFLAGVLQPPLVLYFYIENLIFWAGLEINGFALEFCV
jgi:hypothetical protein